MTRIKMYQPAPEGEQFAPGCFDSQIGKTVPFNIDGRSVGDCTLVSSLIVDDGHGVELTIDFPGLRLPKSSFRASDLSLASERPSLPLLDQP